MQCSAECSSSTYDIAKATFDFHASLVTDDGRYRERRKVQLAKVDAETEEKRGKKRRSPSVNSQSEWRPERFFFLPGAVVSISLPSLISSVASPQSARLAAVLCCSFRSYLCLFPRLADIFTATRPTATAASLLDTGISPGEG